MSQVSSMFTHFLWEAGMVGKGIVVFCKLKIVEKGSAVAEDAMTALKPSDVDAIDSCADVMDNVVDCETEHPAGCAKPKLSVRQPIAPKSSSWSLL